MYRVTFKVHPNQLGSVIGRLAAEFIDEFTVVVVPDNPELIKKLDREAMGEFRKFATPPPQVKKIRKSQTRKFQARSRAHTKTGQALLSALESGPKHIGEIRAYFKSQGLSGNSVTGCVADMSKTGQIHKVNPGVWEKSQAKPVTPPTLPHQTHAQEG